MAATTLKLGGEASVPSNLKVITELSRIDLSMQSISGEVRLTYLPMGVTAAASALLRV